MADTDQAPAQASFRKLFVTSTILLVGAAAVAAFLMLQAFVANLAPEIELKAAIIGRSVSTQVDRALKLGIPFERLYGMDAFLDRVLTDNPDLAYVAVADPSGRSVFVRARDGAASERTDKLPSDSGVRKVEVPIDAAAPSRGTVTLGVSRAAVDAKTYAVVFDMLIVLLVAGLFAFELLSLVFQVSIAGPLGRLWAAFRGAADGQFTTRVAGSGQREWEAVASAWNDMVRRLAEAWQQVIAEARSVQATISEAEAGRRLGRLIDEAKARFTIADPSQLRAMSATQAIVIRAPVFVFIMAEEFSRSFLPVFIRGLREPDSVLSPELAVGIPMTAFMAAVAIITPFAGVLVSRLGVRRMFMLGIAPSAIGYLGTAFAGSIWELVLWRAMAGVGYAVVYIVCQGFVATASSPQKRAQGMALFMGAVFAAGVCGPALGGVVADQIGARPTFLVSTGLCLLSLALMYAQLRDMRESGSAPPQLKMRDFGLMLRNPSFVALLVLGGIL